VLLNHVNTLLNLENPTRQQILQKSADKKVQLGVYVCINSVKPRMVLLVLLVKYTQSVFKPAIVSGLLNQLYFVPLKS